MSDLTQLYFPSITATDTASYVAAAAGYSEQLAKRQKMAAAGDVKLATAVRSDTAGYRQFSVVKRKSGRPVSKRRRLLKALRNSLQPVVYRWQRLSPPISNYGQFPLNYHIVQNGTSYMPFYLFELTGVPNKCDGGVATLRHPVPFMRLQRTYNVAPTDTNTLYTFGTSWAGAKAAGTNALTDPAQSTVATSVGPRGTDEIIGWSVEKCVRNYSAFSSSLIDWADIRVMAYGPKKCPGSIMVDLIQLDPDFSPGYKYTDAYGNGAINTGEDDPTKNPQLNTDLVKWNEFWQGQVDTLVAGPMCKRDAFNVKGMRRLWTQRLDFNPTATYESDARGHMRELKLFKVFNRAINYQWQTTASTANTAPDTDKNTGVDQQNEYNPNVWDCNLPNPHVFGAYNSCQPFPHPRARIYLVIRAFCAYPSKSAGGATGQPTTFDPDYHSSFDLLIRKKHSYTGQTV